jgi:phosphosulfolactate synthase
MAVAGGRPAGVASSSQAFLRRLGVRELAPATTPFDPGYDPITVEGHLAQSAHLMAGIKISMACWMIAQEKETRRKVAAAQRAKVSTVCGGTPFEVAVAQGQLLPYLELCADIGFDRIECAEGLVPLRLPAEQMVEMARQHGLEVQFELGRKHGGAMTPTEADDLIDQGRAWLDAGATAVVIEARESAEGVGLFDARGALDSALADRFATAFGLGKVVFEAPTKSSQFALLSHYGAEVRLGNVRLEELLRVEIYRRGLHSDAFGLQKLRPPSPREDKTAD